MKCIHEVILMSIDEKGNKYFVCDVCEKRQKITKKLLRELLDKK